MEQLSSDMAGLLASKKSSDSFLDIVGADVNSSYDRPIQIQMISDTFHVSTGGQAVGPNQNIQCLIRDDNAIHYLKREGLCFDLVCTNSFVHNAAALFTGLELSIGNVTTAFPFQHFYVQQKLSKCRKDDLKKYARGMALKHEDFSYTPAWRFDAGGGAIPAGTLVENNTIYTVASDAGPQVITQAARAITNAYSNMSRMLAEYYLQRTETDADGNLRVKMFIPFHWIFPMINELPDDGAVFTGYGQQIKMNIRTNMGSDCLNAFQNANTALNYQIKNMQLVKVFSKIDQPRADSILKSTISLPRLKYIDWQQQVSSATINAIYQVERTDLVRGLWFGFHTRVGATASTNLANTLANLTSDAEAQYKSPLSYFPVLPILQIDVYAGGEPISLNFQQISALHVAESIQDESSVYDHPPLASTKYGYHLDLCRFSNDLFGSSAKQTSTITVKIILDTRAGNSTLYQQVEQVANGNNTHIGWTTAMFANFSFYSYLEVLDFIECKGGVYSMRK